MKRKFKDGSHYVCRCDCGGIVAGVYDFGRLWTWCRKCTPVVKVNIKKLQTATARAARKGRAT